MSRLKINKSKRTSKIGMLLYNHINNNKRGYLIVTILFFIGLIVGVFFINNANNAQIEEINLYLNNLVTKIKNYEKIDLYNLLKQSIFSNFMIIIFLWLGASTIIGIPIVYSTIAIKGFSIGYTISSIITCFGVGKGIIISVSIMLLHNIIFIPTMLGTSVSGVKLYQSIMTKRDKDNIKIEILRHTMFCALMVVLMIFSAIVEIYCSTNLFIFLSKRI